MDTVEKIINIQIRYRYEWLGHLITFSENQQLNKIKNDIGAIVSTLFFYDMNIVNKMFREILIEHVNELDANNLEILNDLIDRINKLH